MGRFWPPSQTSCVQAAYGSRGTSQRAGGQGATAKAPSHGHGDAADRQPSRLRARKRSPRLLARTLPGIRVIRADGRSLGRVRRVETKATGTFLRLTGFRFREFPLSAVETVWPAASVLLVAQSETHQRSVSGPRDATRPSWEDETLPWWELLEGDRSSVEDRGWLPALAVPQRTWLRWQHGFITGGLRSASSINSLARKLLTRMRARCKHLYILVQRQAHNGWRETRAMACRMRCWCAAARAAGGNTIARGRVALARLMLRLAVSLAGGRKALFGTMRPLDTGAHDQSGPGDQPEP